MAKRNVLWWEWAVLMLGIVALTFMAGCVKGDWGGSLPELDSVLKARCELKANCPSERCEKDRGSWHCIDPTPPVTIPPSTLPPPPPAEPTPVPPVCQAPKVLSPLGNCVVPSPPYGYACDPACAPGQRCEREGRCGGHDCFSCLTPPPPVVPSPPPPTPAPPNCGGPPVCSTTIERVCVRVDGSTFPFNDKDPQHQNGPNCATWATHQAYMIRHGYYTAGDPTEDGDVAGRPGYWLNYDAQQVLVGLIRKSDGMRVDPNNGNERGTSIDPPYMEKRPVTVCAPQIPCGPGGPPSPPSPPNGPCAAPSSCPVLSRWGVSKDPHLQDSNNKTTDVAVVGGTGHWDSTTRFGGTGNGGTPCNDEHNAVCSCTKADLPATSSGWRRCEDPRGPLWRIDGPATIKHQEGFGIQLRFTGEGKVTVCARPRPDARDHEGKALDVSAGAETCRWITVRS